MAQEMSEVDARKAAKKAAKKEKKRLEAAAAATASETATPATTSGDEQDLAAAQKKKEKREKKEKKRKLADLAADVAEDTVATTAESTPGIVDEGSADTQAKKDKKNKKRKVKGAFGNELRAQAAINNAAANIQQDAPVASTSKATTEDIAAFMKENELSYEPSASQQRYPPVLSFDHLSVSNGIKKGLKSFAKPTPVQSASWGVQLPAKACDERARDCVAIAATG